MNQLVIGARAVHPRWGPAGRGQGRNRSTTPGHSQARRVCGMIRTPPAHGGRLVIRSRSARTGWSLAGSGQGQGPFRAATKPRHQNLPDLLPGCPQTNVRVVDPRGDVPGRDHVGLASVPAAQAPKPVRVPVVLADVPARRIGTCLIGVRGVDRLKAGTSRLAPKLQFTASHAGHSADLAVPKVSEWPRWWGTGNWLRGPIKATGIPAAAFSSALCILRCLSVRKATGNPS